MSLGGRIAQTEMSKDDDLVSEPLREVVEILDVNVRVLSGTSAVLRGREGALDDQNRGREQTLTFLEHATIGIAGVKKQ